MRRLLPQSLAGRLIALLLIALVVAQIVSFAVLLGERREAIRRVIGSQILDRTTGVVNLLKDTPPALHKRIVATATSGLLRYKLEAEPVIGRSGNDSASLALASQLKGMLGSGVRDVRVELVTRRRGWFAPFWHRHRHGRRHHADERDDDDDDDEHHRRRHRRVSVIWLNMAIGLEDGQWLNGSSRFPRRRLFWAWPSLLSLILMAGAIAVIVSLVVRRIARPMQKLAEAADRLGRGEKVDPLPETGPPELQRTTRAFNEMRERLDRFVRDRMGMLAALSHDLRTPITSLRLRAEFIEDKEQQVKIIETLDEMQRMAEAALAFVRADAQQEDTSNEDVDQLLKDVAEELAGLGHDVAYKSVGRTVLACRPVALKRVFRNLIENAVRYGERARVALAQGKRVLTITIDDDGPGIPEGKLRDVFEPFVRLEESRSRDTGGAGLGLAIARSIAHGHGGNVTIENRPEGGLRAMVTLPCDSPG